MILKRNQFLGLLVLVILLIFFSPRTWWVLNSEKTTGKVWYQGKTLSGQFEFEYPVISFMINKQHYWFNGGDGIRLKKGEFVPVFYKKNNPNNAKMGIFSELWAPICFYAGVPLLMLFTIFLHPNLIPKKALFKIANRKPFVEIINPEFDFF